MYKYRLKEIEVGDVETQKGQKTTVTDIDPRTGGITWSVEDVAAFDTVYKTFDKLNQLIKDLESKGEAKSDLTIDSIAERVKDLFNEYRTHVRKNYPEAFERIKMVREELSIKGKKVKTIHKNNSNNPEDHTIEYEDGSTEPYLDHLKEGEIDEDKGIGYSTPRAFNKNKKSTGANDIYYYKLGYKPVPKKIKGADLEVKQLNEKEILSELSDFQQNRINMFDDVEEKLNVIYPLLSNAKNETIKYYNENPGTYTIVYSTDMVESLLEDITQLLN
tara:strand:+ start:43 stop:867 length:825 start_codon:yes stop_codon:yes gene_type:complete